METSNETEIKLVIQDREHAEIVIDTPGRKPNVLTRKALEQLQDHFAILKSKREIKTLLIYSAKPDMFLAGADINEFPKMKTREDAFKMVERVQDLFQELAELPQVTMVAIDGPCMGGGTELALACKYRVCSSNPKTKIALPEVQLGILPGAGGTQRLPRLVPLREAVTIITSGAPTFPKKALRMGLVDDIMPKETMVDICRKKLRTGQFRPVPPKVSLMDKFLSSPVGKSLVFKQARKAIMAKTKGQYPSLLKALEVVEKTYGGDLKVGLQVEAAGFVDLVVTETCKNLIHIFFTAEELKKEIGVKPSELGDFKPVDIKEMAVLGAGIMGGGIAAVGSKRGITTRLKDISVESLQTAMKEAYRLFKRDLDKKKIDRSEFDKMRYRISPTLDWTGFKRIPFVIEAVVENMEIKKKVIQEIENYLPLNAIIASNTSSLSITEMAKASQRPDRIVGMHFFNPVPLMPLVEVIRAERSSPQAVAQTVALGKQMGKTVIVVKDRPGFLVNRILMPYLLEASWLRQEGYSIEQIDEAATRFGMPMGPFRLMDEVGLDTGAKVADVIAAGYPHMKVLPALQEMVKQGYLGKKNGRGFYNYDEKGKSMGIRAEFRQPPMHPGEATFISLQDRLILPMVTESIMALDEGIVSTVRDLDMGVIYGIGFPPFRGGILRWVSSVGEREILDRLNVVHNATKGRILVPKGLEARLHNGQSFYQKDVAA